MDWSYEIVTGTTPLLLRFLSAKTVAFLIRPSLDGVYYYTILAGTDFTSSTTMLLILKLSFFFAY